MTKIRTTKVPNRETDYRRRWERNFKNLSVRRRLKNLKPAPKRPGVFHSTFPNRSLPLAPKSKINNRQYFLRASVVNFLRRSTFAIRNYLQPPHPRCTPLTPFFVVFPHVAMSLPRHVAPPAVQPVHERSTYLKGGRGVPRHLLLLSPRRYVTMSLLQPFTLRSRYSTLFHAIFIGGEGGIPAPSVVSAISFSRLPHVTTSLCHQSLRYSASSAPSAVLLFHCVPPHSNRRSKIGIREFPLSQLSTAFLRVYWCQFVLSPTRFALNSKGGPDERKQPAVNLSQPGRGR